MMNNVAELDLFGLKVVHCMRPVDQDNINVDYLVCLDAVRVLWGVVARITWLNLF